MASDPTVTLMKLLSSNWDESQTSLANPPEFHTGWYSRDGRFPVITFTNQNEGPENGGTTRYTAIHGPTGAGMQELSGYVLVDCVAGTREDCEGVGPNSEDLNPKKVRWELYDHAAQILTNAQTASGLKTVAPGDGQDLTDTDEGSAVFRKQFRAYYTRDRKPNP